MSSVGGRGRWAQGNRKSVPQELAPPGLRYRSNALALYTDTGLHL